MDATSSHTEFDPQGIQDELTRRAFEELDSELTAKRAARDQADQEALKQVQDTSLMPDFMDNIQQSIGGGLAKAAFETKDLIFGEPEEDDKSALRRNIEATDRALAKQSVGYGLTSGVSQMVAGLIGAGKLLAPIKGVQRLKQAGKVGRATYETGKAALASTIVLDPHEERLSNLIEEFPDLQNPVTEYLAADPDDSTAEGRFKNALESIGLDFALLGAVKVLKLARAGKHEAAAREIAALERARAPNASEFGMDFGDRSKIDLGPGAKEAPPAVPPTTPQAGAAEAAIETLTAATPPRGSATQAKGEMPPSEAPGVKQGEDGPAALSALLRTTDDDLQAIVQYGSREAAAEAGQVSARGSRLPWQKLTAGNEVRTLVDNAATVLKGQIDATKGGDVLADATVNAKVQTMAEYFGDAPELVVGELAEAGSAARDMVARMEASYLIANRMFQETYDLAFKLRNGMLDEWGGDPVRAGEELKHRLTVATGLLASARSVSSNSGRALRRMRGSFKLTPEDLARVGDLDAPRLADLLYSTKGDPKKLAQMANPPFLRRVMNEATFSLTNSLLWLYPTHIMNITSSAFMLAGRPTEKLLGSLALGPKSGGDILRQQALREYAYTVSALGDGWEALVEAFKRGDSILNPHNTEYFGAGGSGIVQQPLPWKPVHGVWDIVENAWKMANYRTIVGLPTRSLGAVDEFFKMLRYRAVVQAEAAAKANAMGLVGDDLRGHVSREMEKAIDPATGRALNAGALQEAQVSTFQQELLQGTVGATIQQVRSRHPVLTFVLPFVKTPINVLRYGWKMTPGLNLVQKEFREAIFGSKGPEAKAQAIGQMALGSTFMGLAAALALDGKITGAGPSDPNLRRELAATGWQPYAYVLEADDGSKRYVPIGRLDPAGMAFSMVANLVEIMRNDPHGDHGTAERGIGALGLALAKNFTDRTFLLNLHQALQALSDPGARGERYLGSIAGNTIPLSSAIRGLNPDPYLREARSFIDTMMKNLPGYSETLAPSRDAFGDPVWKRIGMSTTSEADIVEAEHTRIILETGGGIGRPDPKFEGVDLRDIALKSGRQAYDRFQELAGHPPGAKSLKTALAELIRSDAYQDLPDGEAGVKGTRLNALGRIVGKYREAGKKALIRENPELRDLLKARQREARSAYLKSKEERTQKSPGAKALRNALRPRH